MDHGGRNNRVEFCAASLRLFEISLGYLSSVYLIFPYFYDAQKLTWVNGDLFFIVHQFNRQSNREKYTARGFDEQSVMTALIDLVQLHNS